MSSLDFTLRAERPPGESRDRDDDEHRIRPKLPAAVLVLLAAAVAFYARDEWVAVAQVRPLEDFGEHTVGESAGFQVALVYNTGRAPLRIDSASLAGDPERAFTVLEDQCSRTTLPRDAGCAVSIEFTPRRPGSRHALLRFEGNAANGVREVALSGAGAVPPQVPGAHLEPPTVDVTNQVATTLDIPVTVSSTGNSALRVFLVAFEGDPAGFSIDPAACQGRPVPPGEACAFAVHFTPWGEGEHLARLLVHNDSRESPLVLNLRGEGLVVLPPGMDATPAPEATSPTPASDEPPPTPTGTRPGGPSAAESHNLYPCSELTLAWEPAQDDGGPVTYAVTVEQRVGPTDDSNAGDWNAAAPIPCGTEPQCDGSQTVQGLLSHLQSFVRPQEELVRRDTTKPNFRALRPTPVQPAWVPVAEFRWSVRAVDGAGQQSGASEVRYFRCEVEIL